MLLRKSNSLDIPSSEITPQHAVEKFNRDRRRFLTGAALVGAGAVAATHIPGLIHPQTTVYADTPFRTVPSNYTTTENQTPYGKATTYNNFYEFGEQKDEPAKNAQRLKTRPWTIKISGLVKKPQTINIDDLINYRPIESRVYRHRCVEAWSMVIPWDGYSLSEFINFCQPQPGAKYVQFISNLNHMQMRDLPGGYDWPYTEGLRMDEAMNPLTLLTFGCYGNVLPNQNGAPVRIVVPWKYGFKSAKSIVEFHFVEKQPRTLWNTSGPDEYGFYSNVNPSVNHPRWSQAHERRIDSGLIPHTIPTQMFNGYADQVASLYTGMDLKKYY